MKRFLIRFALIIFIPAICCVIVCEYCLRTIPNDYAYKNEWMTKNISEVQILNLGSSHGYYGIEPSVFSRKAFNAAHVSQSIKYDHFVFTKFYNQMDSLQILILPISYGSLIGYGPENGIEDWRVRFYSIYYNCDYHKYEPRYNLEVWYGLHVNEILDFVINGDDRLKCNELGRGTIYKLSNRNKDWKDSGAEAAERHTAKKNRDDIICKNIELIEEMIEMCANKDATVILLTTPTYRTYRENLDTLQLYQTIRNCEALEHKYDNVIYMNLLDDDRFVDDDFFDADHLDEYGADKLTMVLRQKIDMVVKR